MGFNSGFKVLNASTLALGMDSYKFVQSSYPKEKQHILGKLENCS